MLQNSSEQYCNFWRGMSSMQLVRGWEEVEVTGFVSLYVELTNTILVPSVETGQSNFGQDIKFGSTNFTCDTVCLSFVLYVDMY